MKLPTQTHGPLKVTKVEYYPRLSEETLAFNAVVEINGLKGNVQNDGQGGSCCFYPAAVEQAINAYAKTLLPDTSGNYTLAYDADFLLATIIGRAADEAEKTKDFKKMARKGYKVACQFGERVVYCTTTPTVEALVQRYGEEARSVRFTPIFSR